MPISRRSLRWWVLAACALAGVVTLAWWQGVLPGARGAPNRPDDATFVGAERCASCHALQYGAWQGSQHAMAMRDARSETVLGRFDGAGVILEGVRWTFFRDGDRFAVNTQGPDGQYHDYPVRYTFGVYPLQQYLVALPGGRLQPLTVAWDSRDSDAGGQRWFSLEDEGHARPGDELHWSGRGFNWNFMCADCHSTALRKGYDAASDTFQTRFAAINVACEACHGPGSHHVSWGALPALLRRTIWRDDRLRASLRERAGITWSLDPATGNARRSAPRTSEHEIAVCAQCHARREHIADGYVAGASLFDHYDPLPLMPGLYYSDGQQLDEVYDYASFLQSRMYARGVTCADCHDPHTQKLRAPNNLVCARCHLSSKYDTTAHHGHEEGTAGARCVACHMPPATFMEIDQRHDHSLRVPRPDRTTALGVPNACTQCHADRSPEWALERIQLLAGRPPAGFQRFAETFALADRGGAGAADSLLAIVNDGTEPAIVRASALERLSRLPGPQAMAAAAAGARDGSPLVRRWAVTTLRAFAAAERMLIAAPLLRDTTRIVRQEAASALAPVADSLSGADRTAFESAAKEFIESQRYNADRAENRTALGLFFLERGQHDSAEAEFRTAVQQWPSFVDAYVDLAGVLSLRQREADAQQTLRGALARLPREPRLHHALGLSLARSGRMAKATVELAAANALSSGDPEFAYPYAVVLNGTGRSRDAIRVLQQSIARAPASRDVLFALSTFFRDRGQADSARRYASELTRRYPADAQGQALSRSLQKAER